MPKVVPFRRTSNQARAAEEQQSRSLFNDAMAKSKKSSGIDFMQVITGDEKERQRYQMMQRQQAARLK